MYLATVLLSVLPLVCFSVLKRKKETSTLSKQLCRMYSMEKIIHFISHYSFTLETFWWTFAREMHWTCYNRLFPSWTHFLFIFLSYIIFYEFALRQPFLLILFTKSGHWTERLLWKQIHFCIFQGCVCI